MTAAALAAIADLGPGGVSGRAIARDAEVHHEQIQQMFGSVDELVAHAVQTERDRFISISYSYASAFLQVSVLVASARLARESAAFPHRARRPCTGGAGGSLPMMPPSLPIRETNRPRSWPTVGVLFWW